MCDCSKIREAPGRPFRGAPLAANQGKISANVGKALAEEPPMSDEVARHGRVLKAVSRETVVDTITLRPTGYLHAHGITKFTSVSPPSGDGLHSSQHLVVIRY